MERQYRTVWISDAHLPARDCQVEYLLEFIRRVRCRQMYLVGDMIDVWHLKRRWHWDQQMNNVVRSLLGKAKHGTRLVYVPGNHDEGLREFADARFGNIRICTRAVHLTAAGKKYLVMHGDEFDTVVQCRKWLAILGSAAYDYLVVANRLVNAVRHRLGLPYLCFSGSVKRRVKQAMVYMDDFVGAAVHEARRTGMDGVICGHIHEPASRTVDGVHYCNTGDWVESCSAVVEELDGRVHTVRWMRGPAREARPVRIQDAAVEPVAAEA